MPKCYVCKQPIVGDFTNLDYAAATGKKELPSFGPNFENRYGFPAHLVCANRRREAYAKSRKETAMDSKDLSKLVHDLLVKNIKQSEKHPLAGAKIVVVGDVILIDHLDGTQQQVLVGRAT